MPHGGGAAGRVDEGIAKLRRGNGTQRRPLAEIYACQLPDFDAERIRNDLANLDDQDLANDKPPGA